MSWDVEWLMERCCPEAITGCWLWNRHTDKKGYGVVCYRGKHYRAHRLVFMALKGDIPDGLVLDHLCRNPSCVNPDHLEPVTIRENVERGKPIGAAHHLRLCQRQEETKARLRAFVAQKKLARG